MMKHLATLPILLMTVAALAFSQEPSTSPGRGSDAQFVWTNPEGWGRLQVAHFRINLVLKTHPSRAWIELFADSRYHLRVNGRFLGFGPARFYPDSPEYDSYDLAPYLHEGKNWIVVSIMSNGTSTFQLRRNRAGFIAWGEVIADEARFPLSTPGEWKVVEAKGYDSEAPKMTFALGPMEVVDARKEEFSPEDPEADLENWRTPIPLNHQTSWGELSPRSIPHLTNEVVRPQALLETYRLDQSESIYSFRVKVADQTEREFRTAQNFFGFTYIYSPRRQSVLAGIWWGEHFLNGAGPLKQAPASNHTPHRQEVTLELKEGWNYFCVKRSSFWGKWDFYLALPKSAGLLLSPRKDQQSKEFFLTTGPIHVASGEGVDDSPVLSSFDTPPPSTSSGWTSHYRSPVGVNPAIDIAWRKPASIIQRRPFETDEISLPPGDFGLVYDFRHKRLGRIQIDLEAPEGTVFDIGFSEDLLNGRPWLMKRVGLYTAARFISSGGSSRFETFKPYGFRYLQINVLNATTPVKINRVRVIQHTYPFHQTGTFLSSDPVMNSIWEIGWRTLRVCAEDSYTDTPFRERGLYAGDMLPEMAITLAGSSDLRLVKRSLSLFQGMYSDLFHPGTPKHPDEISLLEEYPLLTLEALRWYLDWTGDLEFGRILFPAYKTLLQDYVELQSERGLVITNRVFVDWISIEKDDLESTAFQSVLARACRSLSQLAQTLGLSEEGAYFAKASDDLTKALNTHLWSGQTGAFRDGIKDDAPIESFFPISSALPLLFDQVTPPRDQRIVEFLERQLVDIGSEERRRKTSPYGGFYLLAALYKSGQAKMAEDFIRRYWGPMVFNHNDTAWENFSDKGEGTLSHAWSGSPTFFLTTQVLGVPLGFPEPLSRDPIVISPQAETIDWAKGSVPSPWGLIRVSWKIDGENLQFQCQVPTDVRFIVKPLGRLADYVLWVNGESAENQEEAPNPK